MSWTDGAPGPAAAGGGRHRWPRFWPVIGLGIFVGVGALTAGIVGAAAPPTTAPPVTTSSAIGDPSPTPQPTPTPAPPTSTSAMPTPSAATPAPTASEPGDPVPGSALALVSAL